MYRYSAYGLGIHSEFPLPELITSETKSEVLIKLGIRSCIPADATDSPYFLKVDSNEAVLSINTVGTFLIRNGCEIVVIPVQEADWRLIRRYVVGTIIAILLYQRGLLVLHASSVRINGKSIAFLGEAGSGKSSLAAALHKRGHEFISDDILPVNLTSDSTKIFPGFPQIKLSIEAAEAISCESERLFVLDDWETKQAYRLQEGFARSPSVLHKIYVLQSGSKFGIETLRAQEAVKDLIKHSFPTRLVQPGSAEHFLKCVQLANQIPIYRLERASSIRMLPHLAAFIEDQISGEIRA